MQLAECHGGDEQQDQTLVERVIAFVDAHFASPISLRDVADAIGYSACHLTTTFREATGTPVTAWIIRRRITAAEDLLAQGTLNVAQTCEAVGFNDLCYFTRQFARHVGITPGRFRASNRKACASAIALASESRSTSLVHALSSSARNTDCVVLVPIE